MRLGSSALVLDGEGDGGPAAEFHRVRPPGDAAANRAFPRAGGASVLSDGAWQRVRDALKADPSLLDRPASTFSCSSLPSAVATFSAHAPSVWIRAHCRGQNR